MTTPEMIAVLGRAVEAMQATAERMMQNQSVWMAHQAQTAAQAQPVPGTVGGAGRASTDTFKRYARMEKLAGADEWREWHYQFTVATKAQDANAGLLLEKVQGLMLLDPKTKEIIDELDPAEQSHANATAAELFNVLSLWTNGEANQIVRGVDDMNGYTAWKRLHNRFNPRTPASLASAWRDVIRPKKMKDLREASKSIEAWEAKVALLRREHGDTEKPTEGLKAALLLEMLPEQAQLTVAQNMNVLDYEALKSRVKFMASVQVDMTTPKPMDIGEAGERHIEEHGCDQGFYHDFGLDAVGAQKGGGKGPLYGSCWSCGGAHFQSECPKGSGKGSKGKGKGDGPQKGKGRGKRERRCPAHAGRVAARISRRNAPRGRARARARAKRCARWTSGRRTAGKR